MASTEQLRKQVERLGPPARGRRFPAKLRSQLVEAAQQLRGQGTAWTAIGQALGVAPETARRWCDEADGSTALVPVTVSEPAEASEGVVVVSPGGYRVEGLSVEQAAALLRALS